MLQIQTAFYLPLDTNRLVHIQNTTTTKEVTDNTHTQQHILHMLSTLILRNYCRLLQLIQILLKKFCVTDNPKKFSLYEEYGGDCESAGWGVTFGLPPLITFDL